jgi:hypothetical protein
MPDGGSTIIIDDLIRMKLFVVEMRDFVATLVPAESASAQPEAAKTEARVTVSGKVSPDLAERARSKASRSGTSVSAIIAQFIADYVATA